MNIRYICLGCLRTYCDKDVKYDQFCWKCGGIMCPVTAELLELMRTFVLQSQEKDKPKAG